MQPIAIPLPCNPHVNQWPIIESKARFNVIACGRRFGKTEVKKYRCMLKAPTKRVWWVTTTYDNGQAVWRYFADAFKHFPSAYINHSERLIQFPTGGFLAVKSADSELRSAGLDHVAIDEAAFIDADFWPFVLRPMLLEGKGSADFGSSTNGRNWFWQLYQLGLDPNEPDWQSWHFTSYDNPLIDKAEIDDIRRNTPERVFSQEYLAEFLDDGGAVFRNLKACIAPYPDTPYRARVVIGVDWARYNDYTVLTVLDYNTRQVIEIDRFNQIDWTMQRNRLIALCKRYDVVSLWAESNSIGEPNIEELRKEGLPIYGFATTSASKQQIINGLALAFEQVDIHIPNDPMLMAELQAYTLERLPGGTFRYSAPSGLHDDMVISLALAWHALTQPVLRAVEMPEWFFNTDGNWT